MKHLKALLVSALILNILTYALVYYHNLQPALQVPFWDEVCSILFYALMLYALIISIVKRKEFFAKGFILRSILVLLLCTPMPLVLVLILTGQTDI